MEKARGNTKTALNFHAAGIADQIGGAVMKVEGWLPTPSELITFLRDLACWDRVRRLLPGVVDKRRLLPGVVDKRRLLPGVVDKKLAVLMTS